MRRITLVFVCLLMFGVLLTANTGEAASEKAYKDNLISQTIVIAGFYGGGGNSGGLYSNDYVMLFNRGDSPVSLNGWSTQYASTSGVNWYVTPLSNTTLQPGQYYLIQYAGGSAGGPPLPTPDLIAPQVDQGFIPNLSETTGKLALVSSTDALPVDPCPTSPTIVDLVGYGATASCFEGAPTDDMTRTTAGSRDDNGCEDTDHNLNDFTFGAPNPLNTSSPFNTCNLGSELQASGTASPTTVAPGESTLLAVEVVPATSPPSTGVSVVGDLTNLNLSASQTFFDDGTNGDVTAGDNTYSFSAVIPAGLGGGLKVVPISVTDAQARSAPTSINVTINAPFPNEDPLLFGNPSDATTDTANENNYLMFKPQYSLSYRRATATPNWVAWRLDSTWVGTAPRQNDYRADPALPAGWYQVQDSDYSGSGYNRGHICPSGDRTRSIPDNSATFLMTNFFPQTTQNNGGPWLDLETYLRTLAAQGKEIYIFAGGYGSLGTIANGEVTVPAITWKIALVLDSGENDLERVNKGTRVISVSMPNTFTINQNAPWREFRVSVNGIESMTGFDFFSELSKNTEEIIERRVDTQ
ncbi:MAG: hypothetical protein HKN33_07695 [Pyrinomonadaceae bacterium]|nr:hypothetical protein [Pyrinomonadaceae bacterium]